MGVASEVCSHSSDLQRYIFFLEKNLLESYKFLMQIAAFEMMLYLIKIDVQKKPEKFRDASLKFRDASLKKGQGFFEKGLGFLGPSEMSDFRALRKKQRS